MSRHDAKLTILNEYRSPVFVHPALPNSDIVVYVRQPGPGFYSVVMWAGSDQVLYQRVGPAYWGWMDITPIAFLQATGRFMGKFIGKPFTDNTSKSDQRVIKQVNVRSGTLIDAISLDFTNGSSTGRKSDWFGNQTGKNFSWELNGRALGGFLGAEQQYVQGLMPFWSERYSKATLTNLESCTIEAAKIRQDIETARTRCTTLRIQTDTLQRAISSSLRAPADHAIQGMMVLSGSIEDLYNQTKMAVLAQKEEVDKLVKLCKDQALVVHKRFQTLYNQSDSLRQQGGNLSTELTAQLGASDSTAARLKNLQEVAEGLKASSEAKAATLQNRKETAEQSLVKAQDTKREAEKKRDSAKKARIVRDIFTFGLGEIGDWGDLNKAIDYANKLVESCQRDLQAANEDIQQAAANLSQVEAEITAFSNLNSTFSPLRGELESIRVLAIALKDKNQELTNKAFDISIFLGGLVARTETMPTKLTAAQFAKAILAVEQLLVTPTQVKGLIWDHPEQLESTMEMIADSDEVADDLGDMI
ncbi:hypothetical protein VNI00_003175 [Paramarasmius palmivorus]|uniref:Uncharacterized protein n=1 Tax=Paramarasmius palmivorus TaxID=297713 RepID=A0AAW0DST4_9AGAR